MTDLVRLLPESLVLAGALIALFADRLAPGERTAPLFAAAFSAAAAVVVLVLGPGGTLFGGMLAYDGVSVVGRSAIAALSALWLVWLGARGAGAERSAEAASFALLSAAGGMLMVSSRDLITLFISLELSTMPAYVLIGYRRDDVRGLEGALKYFLLSMLTSLIMLYGFSFLFGLSGSTAYSALALGEGGTLREVAFVLVLVGLFAKMSAAPFHYWTPDAYAGASAASVAYVSTVPKLAGAIALAHLVDVLSPVTPSAPAVLLVAAVASMVLGNLAAFPQSDLRRLMAYSGVAHTGYVLLALAAGAGGGRAAVFYALAYAVPSMGVMLIGAEEGTALDDLAGLAARRPALAWAAVAWLLSLVGIPPMVGFFGKLYLFTSAVDAGLTWAVLVAVAMSVVSAGYYFRVVRSVFFGVSPGASSAAPSLPSALVAGALVLLTLALGVLASPLLDYLGLRF